MVVYKKLFVSYSKHFIHRAFINMAQHPFEEYDKILSVPHSVDQTYTVDTYFKKTDRDLNASGDLHKAKDIVIYVFGEELKRQFNTVVEERCNGCKIDHPSQLRHSCLWIEDDDCDVDGIFQEALARMDISYLKSLYLETADILTVNIKHQPNFFEQQIKDIRDLWKQLRYFGVLVTAIRNTNFSQIADLITLMEAVKSARVKLQTKINTNPQFFLRIPLTHSNKT